MQGFWVASLLMRIIPKPSPGPIGGKIVFHEADPQKGARKVGDCWPRVLLHLEPRKPNAKQKYQRFKGMSSNCWHTLPSRRRRTHTPGGRSGNQLPPGGLSFIFFVLGALHLPPFPASEGAARKLCFLLLSPWDSRGQLCVSAKKPPFSQGGFQSNSYL